MNKRAVNPDFAPTFDTNAKEQTGVRACESPGCEHEGIHKANRSPRQMSDFVWYCMDHAREHNKQWNFFEGLTEDEVENEIRRDTVWQRPTWKLGSSPDGKTGRFSGWETHIRDDFGVFEENTTGKSGAKNPGANGTARPEHDTDLARAFATLDLTPPFAKDEVRAIYKKLVKRHHPDANGGDKDSEERFKEISQAYQLVMQALDA
ncbi:MAG: J domain-containing protein [Rhodospirillaceae bacterium]|nr:J domain-containing protein [Rhodospirillaceae bacterium]